VFHEVTDFQIDAIPNAEALASLHGPFDGTQYGPRFISKPGKQCFTGIAELVPGNRFKG
jgi:hypothetical protein